MKVIFLFFFLSTLAFGQHHHQHPKHNMIMMGESEIFLSHIVYKVPHNYQVLLKIKLRPSDKAEYLKNKAAYPEQLMILLLDHMEISQIAHAGKLVGTMLRENAAGIRTEITKVAVESFDLIYLDEVPLNLE